MAKSSWVYIPVHPKFKAKIDRADLERVRRWCCIYSRTFAYQEDLTLVCRFCPVGGKKGHTITTKYHAAAGECVLSESPL